MATGKECRKPGDEPRPYPVTETDNCSSSWTVFGDFTLNVLTGTCFFFGFLTLFFFTVVSYFERKVVSDNLSRVISELTKNVKDAIPEDDQASVRDALDKYLKPPDMSAEDAAARDSSNALIMSAVYVLIGLFAALALLLTGVFIYQRHRKHRIPIGEILTNNALLLIFVALTETLFVAAFASQYQSIDSNKIRRSALQTLSTFINGT